MIGGARAGNGLSNISTIPSGAPFLPVSDLTISHSRAHHGSLLLIPFQTVAFITRCINFPFSPVVLLRADILHLLPLIPPQLPLAQSHPSRWPS